MKALVFFSCYDHIFWHIVVYNWSIFMGKMASGSEAHYGVRQLLEGGEEADPWNVFQKNSCHYISVVPCVKKPARIHIVLIFVAQQHIVSQGLIIGGSRSHSDTPHSTGFLWINDRPDAETFTWQQTILTTDRHPYPRWDSNPQSQQKSGRRYTP